MPFRSHDQDRPGGAWLSGARNSVVSSKRRVADRQLDLRTAPLYPAEANPRKRHESHKFCGVLRYWTLYHPALHWRPGFLLGRELAQVL